MLQQSNPDDFVLATGRCHTVRKFVELSFLEAGIEIEWSGAGKDEIGINKANGETIVAIDKNYYRPTEVDLLMGNPSKAFKILDWKAKTEVEELVKIMMLSDLKLVEKEL